MKKNRNDQLLICEFFPTCLFTLFINTFDKHDTVECLARKFSLFLIVANKDWDQSFVNFSPIGVVLVVILQVDLQSAKRKLSV